MTHSESIRIVPGADTAILFIHGIIGTPNHFAPFLAQVPESISVFNLLLDGHGKGARDFARSSMRKWEAQVADAIDLLAATHKKILVAAHSMGTLLAIEQAVKGKKTDGLFLIAIPIKIFLRPCLFSAVVRMYLGKIDPNNAFLLASQNACSITLSKNLLHYLGWIPRYLELFSKIRHVRKLLPDLNLPCIAFQSKKDEMVSFGSVRYLQKHSSIPVQVLSGSMHHYYPPEDLALLKKHFTAFIEKISRLNAAKA